MLNDFYKINKQKVILAIIIMIVNITAGFYGIASNFCIENYDGYHINDCPETTITSKILILFSIPLVIVLAISSNISPILGIPLLISLLIFFWYTLSCAFVKFSSKYYLK
jgi:hypothetical protein